MTERLHPTQSERAERDAAAQRFNCPLETCDQHRVECVFYCQRNPTFAALNYEADQYRERR